MADSELASTWTGFILTLTSPEPTPVTVTFDKQSVFEVSGHFTSGLKAFNGTFTGTLIGPWLSLKSGGDHFHGQVHERIIVGTVNTAGEHQPAAAVTLAAQPAIGTPKPVGMYSVADGH